MARIIAVANQKGGVGKTTTAINLGASLAYENMQTLVVDCDPQANSTSGLGSSKDTNRLSIYHALLLDEPLSKITIHCQPEGLNLIPSEKNLAGANVELVGRKARETILSEKLEGIRNKYNFIILDCPPALDLLTLNCLVAADSVLIPIQCEYFALEGVSEMLDTINRIKKTFKPKLSLEGILLTMYDDRINLAGQVAKDLKDYFGDKVFNTIIHRNVRLAEAPSFGKPILLYDRSSRGAECYIQLAREVIRNVKDSTGTGLRIIN